jgi:hypothetical protein
MDFILDENRSFSRTTYFQTEKEMEVLLNRMVLPIVGN